MPRTSIETDSFRHANPIPAASRIGPLLVSSIIGPRDPGGDRMMWSAWRWVRKMLRTSGRPLLS